ncbi:hypothetical protein DFH07DRAFT_822028 [Mycena maculata]|uniref:Uncharacterized protein n=1 Tax=Mycena maculata TaxID=230809 RepID=A0AAD7NCR3_9AGAR|nr:hypothetical protein DFH07DRAFT_822028 [Mycena maculata]
MFPLRNLLRPSLNRLPLSLRPAVRPLQLRPRLRPYSYAARPASLGDRIWFRPDGTPRSKIRGLVITALVWTGVSAITIFHLFAVAKQLQRVDRERYATAPLDTFGGALSYFEDLVDCCHFFTPKIRASIRRLAQFESAGELETRVHEITRGAAEAVHEIMSASEGEQSVTTESTVHPVLVLFEATRTLLQLLEKNR